MNPVALVLLGVCSVAASPGRACPQKCQCKTDPEYPDGQVVDCSQQGLTQVPSHIPPDTTTLLLACNQLGTLHNGSFSELQRLVKLNLAFNVIDAIEENAFVGLNSLMTLNLACNNLTLSPATYPPGIFRPLASLQVLYLNENNWAQRSQCWQLVSQSLTQSERFPSIQYAAPSLIRSHEKFGFLADVALDAERDHGSMLHRMFISSKNQEDSLASGRPLQFGASEHSSDSTSLGEAATNQDYPDEALSHLLNLRELHIDGLTNKTLGRGFRNLTRLTFLDLNGMTGSGCLMQTVSSQTLANAPHLQHVNLSHCDIVNLTADAFEVLKDLRVLDLSFNFALGFDRLGDALEGLAKTKLESLVIDSIVPLRTLGTQITEDRMRHFKKLKYLRELQARFNRIESFEEGALCNGTPPNLKYVYLNANLLELAPYVNDLRCLESLEVLYIDGYNNYWTPPLRPPGFSNPPAKYYKTAPGRYGAPAVRTDNDATLQENHSEFMLPPNLRVFRARHFGLFYKLLQIHVNPNNSLQRMIAGENHFPIWGGPVTGLENLTELDLSNSFASAIDPEFFNSFPSLEVLDISGNQLRAVFKRNDSYTILGGLRSLKELDMSRNDLGHIPDATFINLTNLERLSLATNGMGRFTLVLSHMKSLTHLNLSENQLHTLPKSVRDHLDAVAETRNVTVSMTYNPIGCTCQNIDFLTWIRDSKVFFGTHQFYYCRLADGSLMFMRNIDGTIDQLERSCGSYVGVFVGAVASSLLFLGLLVVALAYRVRWKLRYLYYATRLSFQRDKRHHDDGFEFDAFVSFAGEDMEFVDGELKEELEEGRGLKLCIHERDFVPGQYIASNIVDSVQRSRRTLVVLTRALLASDWCHYELQMALVEAAETGRDVLLFLLYEHVPSHELPREVLFNIQAASYIEFPHTESDRGLFWDRLANALRR
ncbi:hypothetical protein BaRGS_00038644 [Batillaria attramentaria]|uniref:TIR domain-containing protein n=1 Tax=Batillaria attramentaria TaxID=370345 RepID=A0ABD0J642_9CAEN